MTHPGKSSRMRHVFFLMVAADAARRSRRSRRSRRGCGDELRSCGDELRSCGGLCDPGPRANNAVLQAPAGRGRFVNEWSR